MNLGELRGQQAAFLAHEALKAEFSTLFQMFHENVAEIRAAVVREFAHRNLEARFFYDGIHVSVPPSSRSVSAYPWLSFTFNKKLLRSEHGGGLGDGEERVVSVTPLEPLAVPVTIVASDTRAFGRRLKSRLWWSGPADNQRLASIVVTIFEGAKGPIEFTAKEETACFVATVVFGEEANEVARLRAWRDASLSYSMTGRAFVKVYYLLGPCCAALLKRYAFVRSMARWTLRAVCSRLPEPPNLR